jgi:choline kinase
MINSPLSNRCALILAAGRGNRLLPLTHDRPKCLLEVGPEPILLHQIRSLQAAGIKQIEIITGHGESFVRGACAGLEGIAFTHNEHYATTNSLESLGCATTLPGDEGTLILNSDVMFHPQLLARLLEDPRDQVLLADFSGALGEEEMKIQIDTDQRITAISKKLDPKEAQAENLGVLKVGPVAAKHMLEVARTPNELNGLRWVPDSIQYLHEEIPFYTLSTADLPWIEIDYHHDLKRAREVIWPKIPKE